ncbi:hypothetical protein A0H81_07814 [Grifola frondosa]|uniref:Uncharacterized protein n=1 Tax=Grifola frondosa TaxID=5627 RepID=A0A1C7M6U3_GRIFR|nr:hypothetical protein A0H81_07814 [Grifola frondosa]
MVGSAAPVFHLSRKHFMEHSHHIRNITSEWIDALDSPCTASSGLVLLSHDLAVVVLTQVLGIIYCSSSRPRTSYPNSLRLIANLRKLRVQTGNSFLCRTSHVNHSIGDASDRAAPVPIYQRYYAQSLEARDGVSPAIVTPSPQPQRHQYVVASKANGCNVSRYALAIAPNITRSCYSYLDVIFLRSDYKRLPQLKTSC